MKGHLAFVLHAHLPFVRHPEHEEFLEEDWFFEACTETYIPLLKTFERLTAEGIRPSVTLSFSPTLCAMMEDELLTSRYRRYVERRLKLCGEEVRRNSGHPLLSKTARMYRSRFEDCREVLDRFNGGILEGFKALALKGALEIITCTATHGLIPLMTQPESVRAQVEIAQKDYEKRFGRKSPGIWLGECAYDPRVGPVLAGAGFKYFLLDHHGVAYGRPAPRNGPHAPIRLGSGVLAFGRDIETAQQVWSAKEGYPGDSSYREFHRDLGHDAEETAIRPYLHPDGVRRNVGIKYHRVTGPGGLDSKELYDPDEAAKTVDRHAAHFVYNRTLQIEHLASQSKTVPGGRSEASPRTSAPHSGAVPIVTAMYDAELFGHWWFEGPAFLEQVVRRIHREAGALRLTTLSDYLSGGGPWQEAEPEISSWGNKGYFEVWLNTANDWIYPHLHAAASSMTGLASRFGDLKTAVPDPARRTDLTRALAQAARELLLAQASDWPFLMTVGSHVEYASSRVQSHLTRFWRLKDQVERGQVDQEFLKGLESADNIFPDLDYRVFTSTAS